MRLLKWLAVPLLALLVAAAVLIYIKQPHTPPIRTDGGETASPGIASLEEVELGGVPQWILIRGQDRSNPVLLFLHGGPGMPMMYLAHAFQRPLEDDFVVVQWDRRGAGKTFRKDLTPEELSVSRMLSDTEELVRLLRRRFGRDKVYLAGHSFGSYLGMLFARRHPELLHAFIGIGQVVDGEAARTIQEEFIRDRARATGRTEAIEEIDSKGHAAFESWLFEFGAELKDASSWWPLLWTGIKAPEYSLLDAARVPQGSGFSSRHMSYDVVDGALIDHVTAVEIPVYFFTGRHDYTTPFALVENYLQVLDAPRKEIVWFEDSAHFPFFEQPGEFAESLKRVRDETYPAR
ncbi:MAG: alpha/beta fold hydrolase [Candidatus Eisenbacteria bacterium]|nr:alpha/beta fold hydrolase [Candidatus Eisenbacteria bacterium]